jgi:hypothetical protein
MKLDNNRLRPFIDKIRLHKDNMTKYRDQINNLKEKLEDKIENDDSNGLKGFQIPFGWLLEKAHYLETNWR